MNFDGLDLINEMHSLTDSLNQTMNECEKQGIELAKAEKAYNVLLRQKALIEKDSGTSVTFIAQFLRGDDEISTLREKRDIAEVKYQVLQEKIRSLRLQLSIVNSQAGREWSVR